jgi:hypothetical protein
LTSDEIQKEFGKVSTSDRDPAPRVKGDLALDRMRDIVRRAILARGLLADAGIWSLGGDKVDVEGRLVDDAERERWRRTWSDALVKMGLPNAALEAPPASRDMGVAEQESRVAEARAEQAREP